MYTYWMGGGKQTKRLKCLNVVTLGESRPPKITPQERSERIHVDRGREKAKKREREIALLPLLSTLRLWFRCLRRAWLKLRLDWGQEAHTTYLCLSRNPLRSLSLHKGLSARCSLLCSRLVLVIVLAFVLLVSVSWQ